MQLFFAGLVALLAVLLLGRAFTRANPTVMAQRLKLAAGMGLLGVAGLLLLRGQAPVAIAVGGAGLALLTGASGGLGGGVKSPGHASGIETALLRARLDHDSGVMTGEIIAGPFAGRTLASLGRDEVLSVLAGCAGTDARSAAVLEAYLDTRFPDWRDEADTQHGGASDRPGTSEMTPDEARLILDVAEDASADQIRAAWREMMKRNHPDQGGSSYLATKINQAKDALLRGKA